MKYKTAFLVFMCLLPQVSLATLSSKEIDSLLLCYQNRLDAAKTGQEKYQVALGAYSTEKFYKLFIDKKRLSAPRDSEKSVPPHLMFDVREPGYYESMMASFAEMPRLLERNMSLDLLVEVHDRAVNGIQEMKKGIVPGKYHFITPKDLYESGALDELFESEVLMDHSKAPHEVLRPLEGWKKGLFSRIWGDKFLASLEQRGSEGKIDTHSRFPGRFSEKIEDLFRNYYQQSERSKTANGKIAAIAELLRALEVAHFFPDGNQRTYAFVILNKLLIENGLPPAILEDPIIFDGFLRLDSMVREIRQGISNFLNEEEEGNRSQLTGSCSQFLVQNDLQGQYLTGNDYEPLFLQQLGSQKRDKVIETYRRFSSGNLSLDSLLKGNRDLIGAEDQDGANLIFQAVSQGDLENVRLLLQLRPDLVTARDETGRTLLHVADFETLQLLLSLEPKLLRGDARDGQGRTFLHEIVKSFSADQVRHILENVPELASNCAQDSDGNNPLHSLAGVLFSDHGVVEVLLKRNPELTNQFAKNRKGETPLHVALQNQQSVIAHLMISSSPELITNLELAKDEQGSTPLHLAAQLNDKELVEQILKVNPALANVANKRGKKPSAYALDGKIRELLRKFELERL